MKTPVTAERLRQHLQYSWWIYLLAVALTVFGLNILFTMTAPRPADNQKVELLVLGGGREDVFSAYLEHVRAERFPEQEVFSASLFTDMESGMAGIGTRMFAGEGELLLLPEENFKSYASQGLFVALDEQPAVMEALERCGIPTDRGRAIGPDGVPHLYGIHLSGLPVMQSWMYDRGTDRFLSVRIANGNDEVSLRLFTVLLEELSVPADSAGSAE